MAIIDVEYVFSDHTLFQMSCKVTQYITMHEKNQYSCKQILYLQTTLGSVPNQDHCLQITYQIALSNMGYFN